MDIQTKTEDELAPTLKYLRRLAAEEWYMVPVMK